MIAAAIRCDRDKSAALDPLSSVEGSFGTILADPP